MIQILTMQKLISIKDKIRAIYRVQVILQLILASSSRSIKCLNYISLGCQALECNFSYCLNFDGSIFIYPVYGALFLTSIWFIG